MGEEPVEKGMKNSDLNRISFHLGVCSALCLVTVALVLVTVLLAAHII